MKIQNNMREKISAVAIIKNNDGDILFLKRFSYDRSFPDIYCLPGGKVEKNEDLKSTLHREVKEETNLNVLNEEHIGVHEFSNATTTFKMHMYLCEVEGDIKISDEHERYGFLNYKSTPMKIGVNTINALHKYYKSNK